MCQSTVKWACLVPEGAYQGHNSSSSSGLSLSAPQDHSFPSFPLVQQEHPFSPVRELKGHTIQLCLNCCRAGILFRAVSSSTSNPGMSWHPPPPKKTCTSLGAQVKQLIMVPGMHPDRDVATSEEHEKWCWQYLKVETLNTWVIYSLKSWSAWLPSCSTMFLVFFHTA